jgi:N-terminal domain of anti-restriction factor ArdC
MTDAGIERLEQLQQQLAEAHEALVNSDDWMRMLKMASKLHRYSMNNLLLIAMQHPTAEHVAGFNAWKSMGRSVRRGERGIWILAPIKRKVLVEDEKTGEAARVQRVVGFRPAAVFAQDQTDGDPLPEVVRHLEGDAPRYAWVAIVGQLAQDGYRVLMQPPTTLGATGETDPAAHVVRIAPDRSPLAQLKTLLHERAHIHLGHVDDFAAYRQHRGVMEVEAESVAYVVAGALGLDTSAYSVGYLGSWSKGNTELVRSTAERVVKAAHGIVNTIAPDQGIDAVQEVGMEVGVGR